MPVNKRSKFRGSRTCGGGTHKNRRGAGNRGGRGRAGINAHHFVRYYLEMGGPVFGKHGFSNPTSTPVNAVDIGVIDQMIPALIAQGLAKEEGGTVIVNAAEMGIDKILGSGKVKNKIIISAGSFSEQAKIKIEQSGGQALVI
jgi:large subunit ribosomal protein L15